MLKVFGDFNTMDLDVGRKEPRVRIGRRHLPSAARVGLRVLVSDGEDLEVEATLEYDREHDTWWAKPDWATSRDLCGVPTPTR